MTVGIEIRNGNQNLLIDGTYANLAFISKGTVTTDTLADQFSTKTINLNGLSGYPLILLAAPGGGWSAVRSYSNGAAVADIVLKGAVGTTATYYIFALPTVIPSRNYGWEIYAQPSGQLVFSTGYKYMRIVGSLTGSANPSTIAPTLNLPTGKTYAVFQNQPMAYARNVNQSPAPPTQDWYLYSLRGCFSVNQNVIAEETGEFQIVHFGQTMGPSYDTSGTGFVVDVTGF